MTNPDREELVKLANALEQVLKVASVARRNDKSMPVWADDVKAMQDAVTALRRLASSDGGVKEGRVSVPEGQTPLNNNLGHRYLNVIMEGATARDTGAGSPYHGHSLEHVLHAAGWVQRDLRLALDKARAAPPADAGMQEALAYAEHLAVVLWSKHSKDSAPNWKPLTGDLIGLLTQIDNMAGALTAPGATTKSDGGGESRPANPGTGGRAPCIEQTTPATMPAQAGVAPGPSDPSSTRSDVTVESLADWLNKRGSLIAKAALSNPGRHSTIDLARALLDQFEIGRRP